MPILSQGAGPVPFGLWEVAPEDGRRREFTARSFSRDVDPGEPDQKAGRESRLARLGVYPPRPRELRISGQDLAAPKSSRRTARNSGGSEDKEIALRFPEERERPTGSRRLRGGRSAHTAHTFLLRAPRRPPRKAPLQEPPYPEPGWQTPVRPVAYGNQYSTRGMMPHEQSEGAAARRQRR